MSDEKKSIEERIREARRNAQAAVEQRNLQGRLRLEAEEAKRKHEVYRFNALTKKRIAEAFDEAQRRVDVAILKQQQHLDFSDLGMLDRIPNFPSSVSFQSINLSRTKISDLSPLKNLKGLKKLELVRCLSITDISPLKDLESLESLNLRETNVYEIHPLTSLSKLRFLDISATKISDLRPLATMPSLIEGARKDPLNGGISFVGNWVTDSQLIEIGRLSNPERTIRAIRRFEEFATDGRRLDPYEPRTPAGEISEKTELLEVSDHGTTDEVGATPISDLVPEQGDGVHFALNPDGLIGFAASQREAEDDVADMQALLPALIFATRQFLESVAGSNSYGPLEQTAGKYLALIERPIDYVDPGRIWSMGLLLESWSMATERNIADAMLPPLEDHQKAALDGILGLHGAFILSTKQGRTLFDKSRAYKRNNIDSVAFTRAASAFVDALKRSEGLVNQETIEEVAVINAQARNIASSGNTTSERIQIAAQTADRNLLAVIAKISIVGVGITGAHFLNGVLDASSVVQTYTTSTAAIVDAATNFLLQNTDILKLLAAVAREDFGWLERFLLWLQKAKADRGR